MAVTNPMGIMNIHGDITVRVARAIRGNSIEFYEKIPKGMVLNKLKVDTQLVLDSEFNAVENAIKDSNADKPEIIFIFDCALRRIFLMEENKTSTFIKFLKEKYPKAKIIGFNTMGEFAFNRKSEPMATAANVSVGVVSNKLVTE